MISSYDEFRRTKRFGSLDALRCISIVLVIFAHTAAGAMPRVDSLLLGLGGVRLFFAISGFLITTLLLRERDTTGGISLRNFMIRRTLRIFPLYYTILFVYVVMALLTERHHEAGIQFFRNLPYFLTYTSNWFVNSRPTAGADRVLFLFAWSLATEEQFYLIWPTVEKLAGANRAMIVMASTVLLLIVYRMGVLDFILPASGFARALMESISLSICFGVLVAHTLHSATGYRLLAKLWTPLNSLIGLVALALLLVFTRSEIWMSLASAFVVLSCVQCERHVLASLFKWKPLVLIGMVSYGMYLMHLLCNHAVKIVAAHAHIRIGGAGPWMEFACTTLASFIVATISFRYYESIFLRLKHRFEPKRTTIGATRFTSVETGDPVAVAAH